MNYYFVSTFWWAFSIVTRETTSRTLGRRDSHWFILTQFASTLQKQKIAWSPASSHYARRYLSPVHQSEPTFFSHIMHSLVQGRRFPCFRHFITQGSRCFSPAGTPDTVSCSHAQFARQKIRLGISLLKETADTE